MFDGTFPQALNRPVQSYGRRATPTKTATIVPHAPGQAAQSADALKRDRVDFAHCWAHWEPALVAQHHREWFGMASSPNSVIPVAYPYGIFEGAPA